MAFITLTKKLLLINYIISYQYKMSMIRQAKEPECALYRMESMTPAQMAKENDDNMDDMCSSDEDDQIISKSKS